MGWNGQHVMMLLCSCLLICAAGCPSTGGGTSMVEGYLRDDTYSRLVIETDYVDGMEPRSANETSLAEGLAQILDKPQGVAVTRDQTIASRGTDYSWTFAELRALASANFDLTVATNVTKIHTLFVDGHWSEDTDQSKILGVAWSNRHLVMFKDTIETTCNGVLPLIRDQVCRIAEQAVWTHEVGHVLGLVNAGLPMVQNHQDPDRGSHDINDDCVMYWAAETSSIITVIADRVNNGNDDALGFDQACLADIAAVRDRT